MIDRGLPDHKGCKGVLIEEHVGVGKIQVRCSFCKKILTRKELNKHCLDNYYSPEDEEKDIETSYL